MKASTTKRDVRWWARYLAATVVVGLGLTFGLGAALFLASAAGIEAVNPALVFVVAHPAGGFCLYAVSFVAAALIVWRIRAR